MILAVMIYLIYHFIVNSLLATIRHPCSPRDHHTAYSQVVNQPTVTEPSPTGLTFDDYVSITVILLALSV